MNKIWLTSDAPGVVNWTSEKRDVSDVKYIRSDLVEKLMLYTRHDDRCGIWYDILECREQTCTCGLDDLIKEIRG